MEGPDADSQLPRQRFPALRPVFGSQVQLSSSAAHHRCSAISSDSHQQEEEDGTQDSGSSAGPVAIVLPGTCLTGPAREIMQAAHHVKQCGCHSICKKQCSGANQHKINAAWSAAPRDPHAGAVGAQLCTGRLCTVQLCTLTPKSPEINLVGRDCGIVRASV